MHSSHVETDKQKEAPQLEQITQPHSWTEIHINKIATDEII